MKFKQIYNSGYPMMISNPQIGELTFDQYLGNLMVYDGSSWSTLQLDTETLFKSDDFEKLQRFINNIDKYEEILRKYFPEDFL